MMLNPLVSWADEEIDPRVAAIVAKTIGVDAQVLESNNMKRSINLADLRLAHTTHKPTLIQSVEGGHFLEGRLERLRTVRVTVQGITASGRPVAVVKQIQVQ